MATKGAVQLGVQWGFAPSGCDSGQGGGLAQFNSWLVDRYAAAEGE